MRFSLIVCLLVSSYPVLSALDYKVSLGYEEPKEGSLYMIQQNFSFSTDDNAKRFVAEHKCREEDDDAEKNRLCQELSKHCISITQKVFIDKGEPIKKEYQWWGISSSKKTIDLRDSFLTFENAQRIIRDPYFHANTPDPYAVEKFLYLCKKPKEAGNRYEQATSVRADDDVWNVSEPFELLEGFLPFEDFEELLQKNQGLEKNIRNAFMVRSNVTGVTTDKKRAELQAQAIIQQLTAIPQIQEYWKVHPTAKKSMFWLIENEKGHRPTPLYKGFAARGIENYKGKKGPLITVRQSPSGTQYEPTAELKEFFLEGLKPKEQEPEFETVQEYETMTMNGAARGGATLSDGLSCSKNMSVCLAYVGGPKVGQWGWDTSDPTRSIIFLLDFRNDDVLVYDVHSNLPTGNGSREEVNVPYSIPGKNIVGAFMATAPYAFVPNLLWANAWEKGEFRTAFPSVPVPSLDVEVSYEIS